MPKYDYPDPPQVPGVPTVPTVKAGMTSDMDAVANKVNALNIAAQTAANNARVPGALNLETRSSANIANELAGKLPADVIRMIQQSAAERGVGGGFSGSPNEDAAYLRALGLSSLDMTKRGQEDLTAAFNRNPAAKTFDPQSYIMTPAQAAQLNNQAAGINIDAILKQAGLNTDMWKAIVDAQTRQAAIDASTKSPIPWWAVNQSGALSGTPNWNNAGDFYTSTHP